MGARSPMGGSERPTFFTFVLNLVATASVGVLDIILSAVNRAMWAARLQVVH